MRPASENINKIIRDIIGKKDPVFAEIVINWYKIVGDKFSKISCPIRISNYREKGGVCSILYIKTKDSSSSLEMAFHQEIILERIAVYLGFKKINKLKFML